MLSGESSPLILAFYHAQSLCSSQEQCLTTSLFLLCKYQMLVQTCPYSWLTCLARVAIYSAGAGGNYIPDATNFLEFLPTRWAWLVTFMAVWWAVGYTITGLFAWGFMSNYSCGPDATICTRADNMGWRYLHFTCGALVLLMALARVTFIRMVQTPRWLLAQNRDAEVIQVLDGMAAKYNRNHTLTLENLQAEGTVLYSDKSVWSALRLKLQIKWLIQTRNYACPKHSSYPIGSCSVWSRPCTASSYPSTSSHVELTRAMVLTTQPGEIML